MSGLPKPTRSLSRFILRPAQLDALASIAVIVGVVGLFFLDISAPRGVVDGVGYAAVVALAVRLGRRVLLIAAVVATILTIAAAFLLPDAGISIAGEMANRFFAIAAVWIVTLVLLSRVRLMNEIATREAMAKRHQDALVRIVHESLSSDRPLQDKIRALTEIAAETIMVERASIFLLNEERDRFRCLDLWERTPGRHSVIEDLPLKEDPAYYDMLMRELVFVSDDVLNDPVQADRRELLSKRDIRAVIVAGITIDRRWEGIFTLAHTGAPRHWTAEEVAFVHSVGSVVAFLLLTTRHQEALAALNSASEAIYVENDAGRIIYANRAATALAGPSTERGQENRSKTHFLSLFPNMPADTDGGRHVGEFTHGERILEVHRTRLPDGGAISRIADVTARNTAMHERAKLEATLQQAAKMHALGQLAGGVAHDFNNILGAIQGFTRLIAEDLPQGLPQQGFAQRVLNACDRGKELVEQILAFARAGVHERRVIDLSRVMRECEPLLYAALPQTTHLSFVYPKKDVCVLARDVQMSQLVINLCRNASDALEGKPGRVTVELSQASRTELAGLANGHMLATDLVIGTVDDAEPYACIRVSDDGSGISAEILKRIFEPFFTTKGRSRGTGLGLAVVHGVIETHGGACLVETMPGQGTKFSVYLPMTRKSQGAAAAAITDTHALRGRERILIVDDEPDIADMLSIGLDRLGYSVVGVNDPLEALAAFEEDPAAWDAVVTDQLMPGMRGIDLLRRLKAIRPDIKTVLCTGFSDAPDGELAADGAFDSFFLKPTDAHAIASSLRDIFGRADEV